MLAGSWSSDACVLLLQKNPRSWWPTRPKGLIVTRPSAFTATPSLKAWEMSLFVAVPLGSSTDGGDDGALPGEDDEAAPVGASRGQSRGWR